MALLLSEAEVPRPLAGPILVDRLGMPRYWALIWSVLDGAGMARSYLKRQLAAIELLYLAAETRAGSDCLDQILADADIEALQPLLEGVFIELRNQNLSKGHATSQNWTFAFKFVQRTLERGALTKTTDQLHRIQAKLNRLDRLYGQLKPVHAFEDRNLRALPALVVEDLYELVDPISKRNPFRSEDNANRNYALFVLLLHQGLRRSEACGLKVDAVKEEFDYATGQTRNWMNIIKRSDVDPDPRSSRPELKTPESIRQIPIGSELVAVLDRYIYNYRGKPEHPFLFSSQKGKPLSLPMVNAVFETLSESLSRSAKRKLKERRNKTNVSPHDLRHTAAVLRLSAFIEAGETMEVALGKLRAFFGWSRQSNMPLHYSRAYFEHRLSTVWNSSFDAHVDQLRQLDS